MEQDPYAVPAGRSLAALLREQVRTDPAAPAVHIDGRWLSYGDLQETIFRAANAFARAGIGRGDRVGTLLPNNRAFLAAWLGAAEAGATLVPINVNLAGDTLRYIVEHADLHTLLLDASVIPTYSAAFGESRPAPLVLTYGADLPGAARLESVLDGASSAPPPLLEPVAADPALIMYTSGTTGRPKGVVLSRAAQCAHGWYYGKDFVQLGPGETAYTCLPLFHVTSMGFVLGCLLHGAAIAIDVRFSPFGFWQQLRRFEARMFPYVGAMIGLLYSRPERPDDADNPTWRAIGSATPLDLWEPFERRFGLALIETYGQSEMASLWLMPPPEGRKVGTVGKPPPRLDARVVDAAGNPAPPNTVGQIMLRPHDPLLGAQGYFRDPETTRRAFLDDGWYATGDAGSQDEEGYFRFRGRLKEFMRRRGENVSAFEVEREALGHSAVREAAAVGVPAAIGEEEIKLCVILNDGAMLDPADLFRYLRFRLSQFMLPRYIQFYADFPRTATHRVRKFRLAEEGVTTETWDRHGTREGGRGEPGKSREETPEE